MQVAKARELFAEGSLKARTATFGYDSPIRIGLSFSFARFLAGCGELETAIATAEEGLLVWADGIAEKNKAAAAAAAAGGGRGRGGGGGGGGEGGEGSDGGTGDVGGKEGLADSAVAASAAASTPELITQPRPGMGGGSGSGGDGSGAAGVDVEMGTQDEADASLNGVELTAALLVKNKDQWKMALYGAC